MPRRCSSHQWNICWNSEIPLLTLFLQAALGIKSFSVMMTQKNYMVVTFCSSKFQLQSCFLGEQCCQVIFHSVQGNSGNYCASEVLTLEGNFSINCLFPSRENASQLTAEFRQWQLIVERVLVCKIDILECYRGFTRTSAGYTQSAKDSEL